MTAEDYIKSLEGVLARHFAPDKMYHGEVGAFRLAREVGYGLAGFPQKEVDRIIGSLYSRLLVRFTLASGVPMDAKPWITELKREMLTQPIQRKDTQPMPTFTTLYFTKQFIGGPLDGLTYEDETTFTSKARAEQFIKRGRKVIKGIGADYKITDATFTA